MTLYLDKEAFRRYAPKELHVHMNAFDGGLGELRMQRPSVKAMLDQPFGMFSLERDIPIVHLRAMERDGRWHYFPASPQEYLRRHGDELRGVNEDGSTKVGRAQPMLRLEVVADRALTAVVDPKILQSVGETCQQGGDIKTILPDANATAMAVLQPAVLLTLPLCMIKKRICRSVSITTFLFISAYFWRASRVSR